MTMRCDAMRCDAMRYHDDFVPNVCPKCLGNSYLQYPRRASDRMPCGFGGMDVEQTHFPPEELNIDADLWSLVQRNR
jgi:hypothetical protein